MWITNVKFLMTGVQEFLVYGLHCDDRVFSNASVGLYSADMSMSNACVGLYCDARRMSISECGPVI